MTLHAHPDRSTAPAGLDLTTIARELDVAAKARQAQLTALPTDPADEVAVLHRESVERLLGEIHAAQRRLEDGTFGTCTRCRQPLAPGRLELRPWAATCTGCAR
ncbi:MAG TPA: TraR/DksA C4-type zinc finger protein [Nocardioides sp.]|nr:TraR/DksA C4-type zinc finger protein [Nocardioides sp.]